ncbi:MULTISPECIES: branched-chain amino acid ABC transporter substrate-binding protein [unclassified Mesorhizobium]|uniref:branched-chain amino acid ABC transporter substrate-binding protein n=5 Tax=Mesorhizobium TaxID=68287 RepID=UPI000F7648A3|nr:MULTISPECIES: branched-chain amino acid ABC transporter substrate-binding protein [unclassified Mesorhizobium]AZO01759.1 ABC transporter substrate-binding protein [Mesorhizobium sp. M2A.F.Ca.ET.043.02.1.1]RUW33934.1 ABC transporter substrate-binding protein [Mesorhizobium sp. M2A.F.Ca.ET.015.02.1.1]RVC99284.1 ABC transporter substrate-binding protein [Mesorhizobium sp. M2A.F.Ca.ET.029.05.1.1]RWB47708.1 MAG: ABC transporter substrate-binding protein [Mesorhizobium sp.]RWB57277.1 MAG: ABC tra
MRLLTTTSAVLFWLSLAASAEAETLVGVAAPLSGPSAILGKQVEDGAALAAEANGVAIKTADDACTADGGAAAAKEFVDAKVDIVVGFLCTEAIEAALPILKDANIPVITVGVRTESLTDRRAKTGWPVYRLGPRGDDERNAVAAKLTQLWRDDLFAIIDDGTIYGREMAETLRAAVEQAALKPVFTDTFRPQLDNQIGLVGRLKKAGATKVFAGGDGDDIAIMGRDAAQLDAGITFAGGENLRTPPGDVPYAAGTLMIAPPEWSEVADPRIVQAFGAKNIVPDGYTLPSYAAVEIAKAALADAESSGRPLGEALTGHDFATAIGTIRFDDKGDLSQNPFRVFRFDGTHFVPLEGK